MVLSGFNEAPQSFYLQLLMPELALISFFVYAAYAIVLAALSICTYSYADASSRLGQ